MTKLQLAWLGGFFDGEGYIGVHYTDNGRGYRSRTICAAITQKDRTPLDWIQKHFKFGSVVRNKASGCYYWSCYSRYAQAFGERILPYLKTKHKIKQTKDTLKTASKMMFRSYKWLKHQRSTKRRQTNG